MQLFHCKETAASQPPTRNALVDEPLKLRHSSWSGDGRATACFTHERGVERVGSS
jgi:hypothetical protein